MKKAVLCFLIASVYTATAVPIEQNLSDHPDFQYPRYIQFPDDDGNLHMVDLEDDIDMAVIEEVTRNPADNLYLLYTRRNPTSSQSLLMNDAASIQNSNFNPETPTVVIAHSWLTNENANLNPTIRDAYLAKVDTNVIVLDWSRLALSNYITASNGVPEVGKGLGQFLAFLSTVTGASLESMHLVGFSLGAHLVAHAGRELGGRVARVTGLDPAGPLWTFNRDRINPDDAIYVEAIHTDGGHAFESLGIGSNVANADFYPNGGASQPGCYTNICSHNRSWQFFAASVTYNHFIAKECSNSIQVSLGTCRGNEFPMGNDDLKKYGTGVYRVNTRRRYPF